MSKQAAPVTDLDKMIAAMTEGRKLVSELHTAVRDAKQTIKELRRIREEVLSTDDLSTQLDRAVGISIKEFMDKMTASVEEASEAVYNRFDTIMMICMGEEPLSVKEGRRTTIELIKEFVEKKSIPIKILEEIYLLMSSELKNILERDPRARVTGFERLPIMVDNRIKAPGALVVIPAYGELNPQLVEVNMQTGEGAERAAKCIEALGEERARLIPAAFAPNRAEGAADPA
jgi:hypothetical protein